MTERYYLCKMTRQLIRVFPFLLLLLCIKLPRVLGYANWLKCYVDLEDTEVVMNKKIKSHENADHIVELQIQRVDRPDGDWETSGVYYPANKVSSYEIKVKPPLPLKGANMQFVVEYEAIFNKGGKTDDAAATFTLPKMCDGRRSFSRNYNEVVKLEISGMPDSVEVWGAWAIGFGQVSLTPRLVLMKGEEEEDEEL
jgi:hypothetical protein